MPSHRRLLLVEDDASIAGLYLTYLKGEAFDDASLGVYIRRKHDAGEDRAYHINSMDITATHR